MDMSLEETICKEIKDLSTHLEIQHTEEIYKQTILTKLRKIFSEKVAVPELEPLLDLAVQVNLPKIVSKLIITEIDHKSRISYLIDAFWILTNISSGTEIHTKKVIEGGAIDTAFDIIHKLENEDIVCQCIMLLNNVIVDDPVILYKLVHGPVLKKICSKFHMVDTELQSQILYLYHSIVYCYDSVDLIKMKVMIFQAASVLSPQSPVMLLLPIMDLFGAVLNNENSRSLMFIDLFCYQGYVIQLMTYLTHHYETLRHKCEWVIGKLLMGTDHQAREVIKCGLLEHIPYMLHSKNDSSIRNALWFLSNIAAGTGEMIGAIFEFGIFDSVLHYINDNTSNINALRTLRSMVNGGSDTHVQRHILSNKLLLRQLKNILQNIEDSEVTFDNEYLILSIETMEDILNHIQRVQKSSSFTGIQKIYMEYQFKEKFEKFCSVCSDKYLSMRLNRFSAGYSRIIHGQL